MRYVADCMPKGYTRGQFMRDVTDLMPMDHTWGQRLAM